jgi:hypothetical protein
MQREAQGKKCETMGSASTWGGRTLISTGDTFADDEEPTASVTVDNQVVGDDGRSSNEENLDLDYPSQAQSVSQVASKLRQLIVSLNPSLRAKNAYLADRMAYHYATEVHKLERWNDPIFGLQGAYEPNLFQPFVCTWVTCSGPTSFNSFLEWALHDEIHRHGVSSPSLRRILDRPGGEDRQPQLSSSWERCRHPSSVSTYNSRLNFDAESLSTAQLEESCKFCGLTFATCAALDSHVVHHLSRIRQAVLEGSWRSIEADPGLFVGRYQNSPTELEANEIPGKCTADVHFPLQNKKPSNSDHSPDPYKAKESTSNASHPSITLLNRATKFKQIGIASIQMKMVISPGLTLPSTEDEGQSSSEDGFSETSSELSEAHDVDQNTSNNTTTRGSWREGCSGAHEVSSSRSVSGSFISGGQGGQDNGGGDGERRGRKRPKAGNETSIMGIRPRLACPYQVFQPWALDCFKRGPRNPLGGCEDLYRLRCVSFVMASCCHHETLMTSPKATFKSPAHAIPPLWSLLEVLREQRPGEPA